MWVGPDTGEAVEVRYPVDYNESGFLVQQLGGAKATKTSEPELRSRLIDWALPDWLRGAEHPLRRSMNTVLNQELLRWCLSYLSRTAEQLHVEQFSSSIQRGTGEVPQGFNKLIIKVRSTLADVSKARCGVRPFAVCRLFFHVRVFDLLLSGSERAGRDEF